MKMQRLIVVSVVVVGLLSALGCDEKKKTEKAKAPAASSQPVKSYESPVSPGEPVGQNSGAGPAVSQVQEGVSYIPPIEDSGSASSPAAQPQTQPATPVPAPATSPSSNAGAAGTTAVVAPVTPPQQSPVPATTGTSAPNAQAATAIQPPITNPQPQAATTQINPAPTATAPAVNSSATATGQNTSAPTNFTPISPQKSLSN